MSPNIMVLLSLICTISRGVDWVCSYSMSCATSFAIRFSIKGGGVEAGLEEGMIHIYGCLYLCVSGHQIKLKSFFIKRECHYFNRVKNEKPNCYQPPQRDNKRK
jgi:hypothetical protein